MVCLHCVSGFILECISMDVCWRQRRFLNVSPSPFHTSTSHLTRCQVVRRLYLCLLPSSEDSFCITIIPHPPTLHLEVNIKDTACPTHDVTTNIPHTHYCDVRNQTTNMILFATCEYSTCTPGLY